MSKPVHLSKLFLRVYLTRLSNPVDITQLNVYNRTFKKIKIKFINHVPEDET